MRRLPNYKEIAVCLLPLEEAAKTQRRDPLGEIVGAPGLS